MNRIHWILFLLLAATLKAEAPTPDSIRTLLQLTDIPKLVDEFQFQVEGVMKASMQEAIKGKQLTPAERETIDNALKRMVTAFEAELNFQKVTESFVPLYQANLNQDEVNGLIDFYRSPAGNALRTKIPNIMQQGTALLQQKIVGVMAGMKSGIAEAVRQIGTSPALPVPSPQKGGSAMGTK